MNHYLYERPAIFTAITRLRLRSTLSIIAIIWSESTRLELQGRGKEAHFLSIQSIGVCPPLKQQLHDRGSSGNNLPRAEGSGRPSPVGPTLVDHWLVRIRSLSQKQKPPNPRTSRMANGQRVSESWFSTPILARLRQEHWQEIGCRCGKPPSRRISGNSVLGFLTKSLESTDGGCLIKTLGHCARLAATARCNATGAGIIAGGASANSKQYRPVFVARLPAGALISASRMARLRLRQNQRRKLRHP